VQPTPQGGMEIAMQVDGAMLGSTKNMPKEHSFNGGTIEYEGGMLIFTYQRCVSWHKFLQELEAVAAIAQVVKEVKTVAAPSTEEATASEKKCPEVFEIQDRSFSAVVVRHSTSGLQEPPEQMELRWSYSRKTVEYRRRPEPNPIDAHIAGIFSVRVAPILLALHRVWVPWRIVQKFALDERRIGVVLRTYQDVRIFFELTHTTTAYVVDIVLHSDTDVTIRSLPIFDQSRSQLRPIPHFKTLVEKALMPVAPSASTWNARDFVLPANTWLAPLRPSSPMLTTTTCSLWCTKSSRSNHETVPIRCRSTSAPSLCRCASLTTLTNTTSPCRHSRKSS